jgi:hypothetical protein
MYFCASSRLSPVPFAKPKLLMPYTIPKLMAFRCVSPLRRHLFGLKAEHFRGRPAVDVFPAPERLDERLVAGDVSQHPQLDLRVVGFQDDPTGLGGNKRLADAAALLRPHRDVLQVGVGAAEPSRGRHGLVEVRVHFARFGVHQRRQGVNVRVFQLGQLPVLEKLGRQRMVFGQRLQHFLIGGRPRLGALDDGKLQLVEQDGAQLLGRVDVERLAGQGVNFLGQPLDLGVQLGGKGAQVVDVDADAGHLHLQQHIHQRQLDALVQLPQLVAPQPLRQHRRQLPYGTAPRRPAPRPPSPGAARRAMRPAGLALR